MAAMDRSVEIEMPSPEMVEVLRRMTPEQRLAVAGRMWLSARNAIRQMLRHEHPDWTDTQVQQETTRRMLHGAV